jgi:hypothetical protein
LHTDHREDAHVTGSETATALAPRGHRVSRAALVVVALIVVSTLIRFAAAQAFTTPWIAPDEMVYGMLGEGLWSHGTLTLRSFPSPYYSLLTPALIGAPLSAFDLADGIQWARLLQALAMSLVALPTYIWARRLGSRWWAVAAAALVLTAPAFHYSGFLMTEPLTLTVVTVALLMLARALEEPSMWRYGVFVAWATAAAAVRLQALVLLPAFLFAALVDSVAARDRARLRPLLWFGALAVTATGLVALAILATGGELSVRGLLGAYTPVGEAAGVGADRLDEVAWHAFDVSVLGLGVAVLAAAALAWLALSGRDRDPALRAFVSTMLAYAVLLVVQVGLFAGVFVGTVADRYLITLLPLLAIALCAWVARGAKRALWVVVPVWLLVVAGAALVPIAQLATPATLPNTPTSAALVGLGSEGAARGALVVGALVAGAMVVAVPRRLAWVIPIAAGVALVALSVDSGRRISDASAHEERVAIGSDPPGWLDDAGLEGATLLVTGDRLWTAIARTIFWNRAIDGALDLAPATTPFPPLVASVVLDPDGILRTATGATLDRPLVVAPSTFTLVGEKVAERPAGDSEAPGLAAWRPDQPVRIALRTEGFLPNGDFTGTARVTVYACRPGTLDVTILGKSGDPIEALVDGVPVARLETPNGGAATHRIPAPAGADGSRTCVFALENPGYAGSTTIAFTPR